MTHAKDLYCHPQAVEACSPCPPFPAAIEGCHSCNLCQKRITVMFDRCLERFIAISFGLLLLATANVVSERRVLALFESVADTSSYSQYLDEVRRQGYVIERRSATDPNLHLREWDDWKYDNLIIFASGIKSEHAQFASTQFIQHQWAPAAQYQCFSSNPSHFLAACSCRMTCRWQHELCYIGSSFKGWEG